MEISVQPVILSGGSGTRLWPYSREAYPKQFLPLTDDKTLLQQTILRTDGLGSETIKVKSLDPLVVCNEAHRFLVAEQFRQLERSAEAIILEPIGRNTAPAVTLAALLATEKDDDPVLIVMPSDHLVKDQAAFRKNVTHAVKLAQDGYLVTFGIVPDKPETGFGYIRKSQSIDSIASELGAFVEKPNQNKAQEYLDSGDYFWNSGIFVLKASVWLEQIAVHRPDIAAACEKSFASGERDGQFFRADQESFEQCPSDSIDFAVMEKITGSEDGAKVAVVPLDAGWSDLGSWSALTDVDNRDDAGNVKRGDVFVKDSTNSLLYSQHRFLAAVGLNDVIVVETSDAVLVAHKDKAQDIKAVTEHLKNADRSEHVFHSEVHRPWGSYESIDTGTRYQVKRLTVKPGATLSLQMHHHRAEHWIVVSGTAKVTRGEETFLLSENESTYIPLGVTHRLENPGNILLEIIEVQSGSYLGEDDIVRFEDKYNRVRN